MFCVMTNTVLKEIIENIFTSNNPTHTHTHLRYTWLYSILEVEHIILKTDCVGGIHFIVQFILYFISI